MDERQKAQEARRAYYRAWARRNPERVKAAQQRYWQRRAEREAAQVAQEAAQVGQGKEVEDGNGA